MDKCGVHSELSEKYFKEREDGKEFSKLNSPENISNNSVQTAFPLPVVNSIQHCFQYQQPMKHIQQYSNHHQAQRPHQLQQSDFEQEANKNETKFVQKIIQNSENMRNHENFTNSETSYRKCYNCFTLSTPLWRRFGDSDVLCNACGLYQRINGTHRPVSSTTSAHKNSLSDSVQKFDNLLQNNNFKMQHSFTISDTLTKRTDLQCMNCGTKQTSMWRRSPSGESVCNACGLYFRLNGVARPLEMRRESIRTRKRRTKPMLLLHAMLGPDFFKTTNQNIPNTSTSGCDNHRETQQNNNFQSSSISANTSVDCFNDNGNIRMNNHTNTECTSGIVQCKNETINGNYFENQSLNDPGNNRNSLEKLLNHRPEIVLSRKSKNFEKISNTFYDKIQTIKNTTHNPGFITNKNNPIAKSKQTTNLNADSEITSLIKQKKKCVLLKEMSNMSDVLTNTISGNVSGDVSTGTDASATATTTIEQINSNAMFDYVHSDDTLSVSELNKQKGSKTVLISEFDIKRIYSNNSALSNQCSYQSHHIHQQFHNFYNVPGPNDSSSDHQIQSEYYQN